MLQSECVLHTGARTGNNNLYGSVMLKGKKWRAHRLAFTQAYGAIPEGMQVLHKCDVPLCINPEHLYLGTVQDNMDDRRERGRHYNMAKTHCKRGHELTGGNLIPRGNQRQCRICQNMKTRERRAGNG